MRTDGPEAGVHKGVNKGVNGVKRGVNRGAHIYLSARARRPRCGCVESPPHRHDGAR